MPSIAPTLTDDGARRFVEANSLIASERRRVGVELEWLTVPNADARTPAPFDVVRSIVASTPLPGGCVPTFEPGGQLELSSPPFADPIAACDALRTDSAACRDALASVGIDLVGMGLDPLRAHRRVIDAPRYRAMEAYFDHAGPDGRRMMCRTAAIQINVEAGSERDADRRWRVAHALGPVLGAAFANSPTAVDLEPGWRSGRLATWWAMDRSRTWPAVGEGRAIEDWIRYVLAARVMFIRTREERFDPITEDLPFARWLADGHELGWPTEDDLAYHLTTLFPPVRLRGWLELRMIDSLPDPWWQVAVAVTTTLLDDPETAARAERVCTPAADLWHQAARFGLEHPVLQRAADDCFTAVGEALPRLGINGDTADLIARYHDRYVARGRTPADDALDHLAAGRLVRLDEEIPEGSWT